MELERAAAGRLGVDVASRNSQRRGQLGVVGRVATRRVELAEPAASSSK